MSWLISKNPVIWLPQILLSGLFIFNNPVSGSFFSSKLTLYSHINLIAPIFPEVSKYELLDQMLLVLAICMVIIGLHNAATILFPKVKFDTDACFGRLLLFTAIFLIVMPWISLSVYIFIMIGLIMLNNVFLSLGQR